MAVSNKDRPTLRIMPPRRRHSAGRIGEATTLSDELSRDKRRPSFRPADQNVVGRNRPCYFGRGGRRAGSCAAFAAAGSPGSAHQQLGGITARMSLTLTLRNDAAAEG